METRLNGVMVLYCNGTMVHSFLPTPIAIARVKNLHGIPWNSMDFHGKFSMEFHGGLGHQFPWNFMEISP